MEGNNLELEPPEDTSRRWITVLLYNLFVAIWLLAGLCCYALRQERIGGDAQMRDVLTVFGTFFALALAVLLLLVWRQIPGWFHWILFGGLIVYLGCFAALMCDI